MDRDEDRSHEGRLRTRSTRSGGANCSRERASSAGVHHRSSATPSAERSTVARGSMLVHPHEIRDVSLAVELPRPRELADVLEEKRAELELPQADLLEQLARQRLLVALTRLDPASGRAPPGAVPARPEKRTSSTRPSTVDDERPHGVALDRLEPRRSARNQRSRSS